MLLMERVRDDGVRREVDVAVSHLDEQDTRAEPGTDLTPEAMEALREAQAAIGRVLRALP